MTRRRLLGCDVVAIRRIHAAGWMGLKRLAWLFERHPSTIRAIVRGYTWKGAP